MAGLSRHNYLRGVRSGQNRSCLAPLILLSPDQNRELQRWVALGTPRQVVVRYRMILALAAGKTELMVAAKSGVNRKTARLWQPFVWTASVESIVNKLALPPNV